MFDWSGYGEKLVKRGEILLNLEFIKRIEEELKEMNKGKKGRPYKYPNSLFVWLGYFYLFTHNYRILEGICKALSEVIPEFPTPDHSTIQRRLKAEFEKGEIDGDILIVDSTGFQMGRTTEYVEYRHKLRRRKKWIKLHIITDGKRIVEVEITANNAGDSPVFRKMFNRLKSVLAEMGTKVVIIGDAAYDARENFNIVDEDGHKALFKVRENSSSLSRSSPARRKAVIEQRDKDWAKKSGYTKRWLVESLFSALKRQFGEKLSSRKFVYAVREVLIMVSLFNVFHSL
jgi:transposase